ncbi:N-formylglutamate amidohydrolase [Algibacter sp. 2305UL17-15]|uniref:N-formylglutamate amidohydrolase n=1 Tax=Algibacter sp. 2305UL17-15 TaxID=3231268 RepID=UPI0034581B24
MKLVLTCEHAGNTIPKAYNKYFKNSEAILETHRALDLGALDLFKTLEPLADFKLYSETSRLLIELNRSLHHPNLFSEFTKQLSEVEKGILINTYYLDYRTTVENAILNFISNNETVFHLSVHSFTPILDEVERNCEIGLLYDSRVTKEKAIARAIKKALKSINPDLNVRYNYPYLGKADGFTTHLRKKFTKNYIGIELEVNQKFADNNSMDEGLKQTLLLALKDVLNSTSY